MINDLAATQILAETGFLTTQTILRSQPSRSQNTNNQPQAQKTRHRKQSSTQKR